MTITVPTLLLVAVLFLPPIAAVFWMLWSFLSYLEPRVVRWSLHRDGYSDEEIDHALAWKERTGWSP